MTRKRHIPRTPDLNLAPILNIVVILIPMMLLAVVFLSAGVINVSQPTLGPLVESDVEPATPPPTIGIASDGFYIQTHDGAAEKVPAKEPETVRTLLQQMERARQSQDYVAQHRAAEQLATLYDYDLLYEKMEAIDDGRRAYNLSADPNMPHSVMVRTMDAVRHRLVRRPNESIWLAQKQGPMFSDPVLAIAQ